MCEAVCPHLTTTTDFPFQHSSFELLNWSVNLHQHYLQLVCLYCAPPNKRNKLTEALFSEQFSDLLEYCNTTKGSLLLVGNLNIHTDVPTNPLDVCLSALLNDHISDLPYLPERSHLRPGSDQAL